MENLDRLLKILCDERGEAVPQKLTERQKADWFRALCNVRPPMPVSEEFLLLQNEYLTAALSMWNNLSTGIGLRYGRGTSPD